MTKQEAIDKCLAHWEFRAETGTYKKCDYSLEIEGLRNNCYFCELAQGECHELCPGINYWTSHSHGGCLCFNSLYAHWVRARHFGTIEDRKLWAHRVVWMIWLIGEDLKTETEKTS